MIPQATTAPQTGLRREFQLPEDDVAALNALGNPWEAVIFGTASWLFIHEWRVPAGFSAPQVTAAIRIVPGYPAAALDMIYVYPALERLDRRVVAGLSMLLLDGKSYQQWSRHYTPTNPWRLGVDDVASHLRAAEEWLRRAGQ
jgi:hypothetical protein